MRNITVSKCNVSLTYSNLESLGFDSTYHLSKYINKLATVLTPQSDKIFTRLAALVKLRREFNDSAVHL